jgi:competence protein ComFC
VGKLRNIYNDYILSWFDDPEVDIDKTLKKFGDIDPVPLIGEFDHGLALDYYREVDSDKRTLIGQHLHRFKYKGNEESGQILSILLKSLLTEVNLPMKPDYSTCVPVTLKGRRLSPMNYILSRIDSDYTEPFITNLILRRKVAPPIKTISQYQERKETVNKMFCVNEKYDLFDKTILLFDDIRNTGLTLNECSRILKEAGAAYILAVTLVTTQRR